MAKEPATEGLNAPSVRRLVMPFHVCLASGERRQLARTLSARIESLPIRKLKHKTLARTAAKTRRKHKSRNRSKLREPMLSGIHAPSAKPTRVRSRTAWMHAWA